MPTMVLGILIAAITAPGLLGSQEAIRQGQSKDKKEEHRARRCNLVATCLKSSSRSREIDGRPVVLRDGKLWVDTTTDDGEPFGHAYAGYYLPYPDTKYEGLVTTITDIAPIMNWVYIDRLTHEVKYGVRADAQPNLTGPFDCTRQDRRLTFDGWEGWCAVEQYDGHWCLYFDVDDDGLKAKVAPGIRVLEIELNRKEKRFRKEPDTRRHDQTTKRAIDNKEDTLVDRPMKLDAETKRPGVFPKPLQEQEPIPGEDAMPKTPPPAYSNPDHLVSPPAMDQSRKAAVDALDDLLAMEGQAPVAPTMRPQKRSPLPSLASQVPAPPGEKRMTQRINRNSGSKAIAQAQIFEAMAAAQMRNDNIPRQISGNKRVSLGSSNTDSASAYSDEEQILSREIRPQSSVSQRTYHQADLAPPLPTARAPKPGFEEVSTTTPQQSVSLSFQETVDDIGPAAFGGSLFAGSKRKSQTGSLPQQRGNSKTFTARRLGKRVSPRSSTRRSLTETTLSGASKPISSLSSTYKYSKMQLGSGKIVNKVQTGRKTTSTVLRDLEDLVDQERLPILSKRDQKSPPFRKGLPSTREGRGGNTLVERPVKRK